jgi:hypothetical protein
MEAIFILLLFLPAVLALGTAIYSMIRYLLDTRNDSLKTIAIISIFGIFSPFVPKLLTPRAKLHFKRFVTSALFFVLYCGLLIAIVR